jgi:hypothetical protein
MLNTTAQAIPPPAGLMITQVCLDVNDTISYSFGNQRFFRAFTEQPADAFAIYSFRGTLLIASLSG